MAAATGVGSVVRLGEGNRGSKLSSLSVFQSVNGIAQLKIDGVTISSPESSDSVPARNSSFSVPRELSDEEARASVLVYMNKLQLSSPSASVYCDSVVDNLSAVLDLRSFASSSPENMDYESAVIGGISALLDYRTSALGSIADAVAALSCEALGADISAFKLTDPGDGSVDRDEVSVASNMMVFLNDSKRVNNGGNLVQDKSVSGIRGALAAFRDARRSLRSKVRVLLRSPFGNREDQSKFSTCNTLSYLARTLVKLSELSFCRAELLADLITMPACLETLRPKVTIESIKKTYYDSRNFLDDEEYVKCANSIYDLLEGVSLAVSWEAALAFYVLLLGESSSIEGKKKKNKKVLGKGSKKLMELFEGNLFGTAALFETRCQDFLSFFDPLSAEIELLQKTVKEIMESNDNGKQLKVPKGTRDIGPEEMALRERALETIVKVFKQHDAVCIDTPCFEMRETLMEKYGEDSKLIYDLADQGGEICSLRYDLTLPFARYVAMNKLASFRRYQIGKVFRRDNPNPSKGRFREFMQCDFDIAGQFENMGPEFEIINILTESLKKLGIEDFEVKLNHRKLLDGMMAICGVPPEKFRTISSSIDKLDKLSLQQVKEEMVEKGLTEETADAIGKLVSQKGPPMEILSKLKQEGSMFMGNAESKLALNELETLFKALEKAKCNQVVFDLSLARGLDYYTGVVFEAVPTGTTEVGSIAGGGRYNIRVSKDDKNVITSVGMSLGIERIFSLIMEKLRQDGNKPIRPTEIQVLVSILGNDLLSLAAELVGELWDGELKAAFMVNKNIKKLMERAYSKGIPWMVIAGERELEKGIVILKNMDTKLESEVPRSSFVEELRARLNGSS